MTYPRLADALGCLDDDLLAEAAAEPSASQTAPVSRKWKMGLAACACLCILIGACVLSAIQGSPSRDTADGSENTPSDWSFEGGDIPDIGDEGSLGDVNASEEPDTSDASLPPQEETPAASQTPEEETPGEETLVGSTAPPEETDTPAVSQPPEEETPTVIEGSTGSIENTAPPQQVDPPCTSQIQEGLEGTESHWPADGEEGFPYEDPPETSAGAAAPDSITFNPLSSPLSVSLALFTEGTLTTPMSSSALYAYYGINLQAALPETFQESSSLYAHGLYDTGDLNQFVFSSEAGRLTVFISRETEQSILSVEGEESTASSISEAAVTLYRYEAQDGSVTLYALLRLTGCQLTIQADGVEEDLLLSILETLIENSW